MTDQMAERLTASAEDIARAVLHIVTAPPHAEVGDIVIRSTDQKV